MLINAIKKDNILTILLFFLYSSFILSFTKIPYSNVFYVLKFIFMLIYIIIFIVFNKSSITMSKQNILLFFLLSFFSGVPTLIINSTVTDTLNLILLIIIYLPLIFIVFPNVDQNLMKKSLKLMYVSLLIFIIWPSLFLTYFNQFYYLQAGRYRFISYFNNPNELAQFSLVFLLLSFYYLFIEKNSIKKNIWNSLFGCSSFYIILLTGSRAVLLAISVFVIIYFSTVIFHIEKKQRNFIFLFTFLIIVLVLFSNYLLARNTGIISYIDQLSSYRLSIWREILKYKDPLYLLIGGYLQSHKQYQVITNAYVEVFGNYGLIGLICWCLTLLNFSINKRVSTKFDKYNTAAICAYLVYYLFESGMQNIVNISSFFFWLTLCVGKMSSKVN